MSSPFAFRTIRRTAQFFGLALVCLFTTQARAQLFSADPYDPYGRAYRSFAYPGAGDNPSLPNATRYPQGPSGGSRANRFQDFANDPSFGGLGGFDGRSSRYDAAFRRYDRDFGRVSSPAQQADAKYIADRDRREQAMIKAMRERDPKRRDQLVRQVEEKASSTGSELGPSLRRGASPSSTPSAPPLRSRASTRPSGTAPAGTAAPARAGAAPTAAEAAARGDGTRAATPPPPPLPSTRRARAAEPRPSEVLERSRRLDSQREGATESPSIPPTPPR